MGPQCWFSGLAISNAEYKYIFQIEYAEAILSNSTRTLLCFSNRISIGSSVFVGFTSVPNAHTHGHTQTTERWNVQQKVWGSHPTGPVGRVPSNSGHNGDQVYSCPLQLSQLAAIFSLGNVRSRSDLAAWRSGQRSSSMNEVNARRARLLLGWVTVFGRVYHLGM